MSKRVAETDLVDALLDDYREDEPFELLRLPRDVLQTFLFHCGHSERLVMRCVARPIRQMVDSLFVRAIGPLEHYFAPLQDVESVAAHQRLVGSVRCPQEVRLLDATERDALHVTPQLWRVAYWAPSSNMLRNEVAAWTTFLCSVVNLRALELHVGALPIALLLDVLPRLKQLSKLVVHAQAWYPRAASTEPLVTILEGMSGLTHLELSNGERFSSVQLGYLFQQHQIRRLHRAGMAEFNVKGMMEVVVPRYAPWELPF